MDLPDPRHTATLWCRVGGCHLTREVTADWRTPETAAPALDAAWLAFRAHLLGHLAPAPGLPPDRVVLPQPMTVVWEAGWEVV